MEFPGAQGSLVPRRGGPPPASAPGNKARAQGSFEKYSHYVRQERDQVVLEVVFAMSRTCLLNSKSSVLTEETDI